MHGADEAQVHIGNVQMLEQDFQSLIVWTKLSVPQQTGTYLKRARLVDRVYTLIDRKLILVRAPAGYGKTSLLIDLAHETDLRVCWYSVEEQDADLSVFLTYLIASISRRFPSFGQRSLQVLRSLGSQIHTRLRMFTTTLVDEMLKEVPEYFFLILDDYHVLGEDSPAHEFIRLLLDFMPEQCHLILSSRTVPPLPLIRLVARQQMAAIGVDDLRFTEQEIRQLVREKLGIALSADEIRFLSQQTDGWITAIWLTANMGWDAFLKGSVSAASGLTETSIYDYLMSEVFSSQPEEVKRFLLETSVLSEMTISLCSELVGQDSEDTLRMLEKSNLFITRVEELGVETTYRYHPLFHEFLVARLRDQSEQWHQDLNARAAELLANRQNWQAAIPHGLRGQRFSLVRQMILAHFDALNLAGRRESVAQWIDALPPEYVCPTLQLKRAVLAADLGQIDTALRLYTNAIVLFESQGNQPDLALALIERSYALSKIGRYPDAVQDCQQALSFLPDGEPSDSLRGRAYRYLGRFYGETGDPESALYYLALAYEHWERCGESAVRMAKLIQDIGVAYEWLGQLSAAIEQYVQALPMLERLGTEGEVAFVLNSMGVAHHRLGEYETALEVLQEALEKSQQAGALRAEAYALASLGDLCRDLAQFKQAVTFFGQAAEKAETIGDGFLRSYIVNARAEALCQVGQADTAQAEIERVLLQGVPSRSHEARCRLTLATAFLAQQKGDRAHQELDRVLALPGVQNDLAFRGHMQLAQVAMLEDQPEDASTHLHTAFQLAEASELVQPLSVESLNYIPVLQFAAQRAGKSKQLSKWIAEARKLDRVRKKLAEAREQVASDAQHPPLKICALGGSSVLQDGAAISWRTTQAKELFFYMLNHPYGQTKEQIGAAIWPDHSKAKLFSIFRSSLFRVRKALFPEVILFEEDQYRLNPDVSYQYDVQEFEHEISQAELADNPVQKAYHHRRAVELYHGPFLADLYADWVVPLQEGLQARYLQALAFLAEFHLETRRHLQAIEFARQILAVDEYYEGAYYVLIQAYTSSGQRPQAMRVYTHCRDMLAEFGLKPQKRWEELCP